MLKKLRGEIQQLRTESADEITRIHKELEEARRVLRSSTRQYEYTEWYAAFVASHPAPTDYEKQLADYITDMYALNKPDLIASIAMWKTRVDYLELRLAKAKEIQHQLEDIVITKKESTKDG